ncbi:MAG: type IX secretion system plug protein domain-containing protein [Candidatus Kapaibacterium sp.]
MRARSSWRISLPAALLLGLLICGCVVPRSGARAFAGGDSLRANITKLLDVRIHGAGDASTPPILRVIDPAKPSNGGMGASALTLEFEIQSGSPPNLTLQLIHCDHNWVPTENVFVQDPVRLSSSDFTIERSPIGVTHYDYLARITFPESNGRIVIEHSGNYLARVLDYYDRSKVLGQARFFAVESKASVGMDIASDFYESAQTTVLQHGLKIRVEAEPDYDLFSGQVEAIHLYRQGEWYSPLAADRMQEGSRAHGEPWITFYPSFGSKAIAQYANVPSGNEHRLLDLSDLIYYPSTGNIVTTPLSDLPRREFNQFDNGGVALDRLIPTSDADYVYFQFRLDLKGTAANEDIFVVGTFNNWIPSSEWRMNYDKATGFYTASGLLRRAVQEYQYVSGQWDEETGTLRHADPTLLEGNLSTASQSFFAFVYYKDISGGGFDRIVGAGVNTFGSIR